MATTVPAPVNNSIALAENYLPILDEIYTSASRTAILDTPADRAKFVGASVVQLFTLEAVGLGNYSRNAGYVPGDVNGSWVPYELELDRGRSYMVDALDNEESKDQAFGGLLGVVEREHIIPEIDAVRFATYATNADPSNIASATIATGAAAVDAIDTATATLDDAEVPYEGRILFVSPQFYKLIKSGVTRFTESGDRNYDANVTYFNDMRVIVVPSARFNTAVTLASPADNDDAGDYTATGDSINFMIVHPTAVMQVMKHYVPRIFSPEQNIEADAWRLNVRYAAGCWVKSQKANGIYVHTAP